MAYLSGKEIRKADRVLYSGEPGIIEFVASSLGDPETDWYVTEYGGGVMILAPNRFGRVFIPAGQIEEADELEFVARNDEANTSDTGR